MATSEILPSHRFKGCFRDKRGLFLFLFWNFGVGCLRINIYLRLLSVCQSYEQSERLQRYQLVQVRRVSHQFSQSSTHQLKINLSFNRHTTIQKLASAQGQSMSKSWSKLMQIGIQLQITGQIVAEQMKNPEQIKMSEQK